MRRISSFIILTLIGVVLSGCILKSFTIPITTRTVLDCNIGRGTLVNNLYHDVSNTDMYAAITINCEIKTINMLEHPLQVTE